MEVALSAARRAALDCFVPTSELPQRVEQQRRVDWAEGVIRRLPLQCSVAYAIVTACRMIIVSTIDAQA
jgi:hypothetical protein